MPAKGSEIVDLELDLKYQTQSAYLVSNGDKDVWLPKSMTEYDPDSGTFTIPVWKAQQEGLV